MRKEHSRSCCLHVTHLQVNLESLLSFGHPLNVFFMLTIENFIVYTWNNGSCYTILSRLFCTNIKLIMHM